MRNWTPKLCSGCGETREFPPRNGVCYDCHRLLRRAIERADLEAKKKKAGLAKLYKWNHPYMGHCYGGFEERLNSTISTLASRLSVEPVDRVSYDDGDYLDLGPSATHAYGFNFQRIMSPELAEMLAELVARIRRDLEAAYRQGKRDGQDILKGLMDGSLSQLEAEAMEGRRS